MKMKWYASVNYGLEKIVGDIIKTHNAENVKILDSALIFSCENEINIKCINNLFIILSSFYSKSIIDAAKKISRLSFDFPRLPRLTRLNGKTFRVVVMERGKLRAVPQNIMNEIEKNISRQTKLSAYRAKPDIEIWLNLRNDGTAYFMVRVKKHPSFEKTLKQGELRPDVVDIMLHKAKINKQSVIADIFGGWGAIAAAVAESGRYGKIYTGDINDECVQYQKARLRNKRNCVVRKWDACSLQSELEDISVDAVITDPPWGEYEQYEKYDIPQFYDVFIGETARILRPNGSFVFLTSQQNENETRKSLEKHGFSFSQILLKINGKDTFLFCAQRAK
jgi:23S rRNA G2445 N2-methylase RlmL